jgi:predicted PurR-regulated permease PerM
MSSWIADRSRRIWGGIGVLLALVVVFFLWSFVGTFVFGVFFYYATRPVYKRLTRRLGSGSLAAALSLLLVALPAVLLLGYTITVGLNEFNSFSSRYDAGQLESLIGEYAGPSTSAVNTSLTELNTSGIAWTPEELAGGGGIDALTAAISTAGQYLGLVALGLIHLFVMIAIAFYLLRDDHRLSRWVLHRFGDDAGILEAYLDAVDRSYNQIFFGNILNAVMTGIIGALSYSLLNLLAPSGGAIPYPALLGLLAGLASLVPIVGMKLVYVPAVIYLFAAAFLGGDGSALWFPTAFALVSFVIVDTIPDLVLRPYVSGRNLHVGMVMFAYILGPLLFGWYGLFLAPMLLVLAVHFARIVLPELTTGTRIQPMNVDPGNLPAVEATTEPSPDTDPDEPGGSD